MLLADRGHRDLEAALLQHPDVARAAVVEEEGPDGHRFAVAYVVPSAERMSAAKARIHRADCEKRVARWRTAFDFTYRAGGGHVPDFVGWKSSYTNEPIPQPEMQEWLDRTVERIAAHAPKRILEIGCGVGLLVARLAPRCPDYRATDLSPIAVRRLRSFVASRPELAHVELMEREATDFAGVAPASADMVVLNSVAQYFPDAAYLTAVLERAASTVAPGGHIFVGDLRHFGLLPLFHASLQLAKAPAEASLSWLRRRVELAVAQERELAVDPCFFHRLSRSIPRISEVEILLKRGAADNELTRYRYDVVLHLGEAPSRQHRPLAEWRPTGETAQALVARFRQSGLPAVRIPDLPNRRLARDLACAGAIAAGEPISARDLRERIAGLDPRGVDPEDFRRLEDPASCVVGISWASDPSEGRFDVVLRDPRQWSGPVPRHQDGEASRPVATDPLGAAFLQELGSELAALLRNRFPEPELPAAVLAVERLPEGAGRRLAVDAA